MESSEKIIKLITKLQHEIERLKTQEYSSASSSGGVTDHGGLSGLTDDDHPQYAGILEVQIFT